MVDRATMSLTATLADDVVGRHLEHIERRATTNVDDLHPGPIVSTWNLERHLRVQSRFVEADGAVHVAGERGDMIEASRDRHHRPVYDRRRVPVRPTVRGRGGLDRRAAARSQRVRARRPASPERPPPRGAGHRGSSASRGNQVSTKSSGQSRWLTPSRDRPREPRAPASVGRVELPAGVAGRRRRVSVEPRTNSAIRPR